MELLAFVRLSCSSGIRFLGVIRKRDHDDSPFPL